MATISFKNGSSWETYSPYPVGAVIFSYTALTPGNLYGGTWAQINSSKYIRIANDSDTGGSASASHVHGSTDMIACWGGPWSTSESGIIYCFNRTSSSASAWTYQGYYDVKNAGKYSGSAKSGIPIGGNTNSTSIDITPEYQDLYCYRRTA